MSIPVESEWLHEDSTEPEDRGSIHDESGDDAEQLSAELQEARAEIEVLKESVATLETQVEEGKDRIKRLWRSNC